MMKSFLLSLIALAPLTAALNLTTTAQSWKVETLSPTPFTVVFSRTNCDITSLLYGTTELQNQVGPKSHIASGFDTTNLTLTASTHVLDDVEYFRLSCAQTEVTHYYILKTGDAAIYMGTWATALPDEGGHRWIARLNTTALSYDEVNQASSVIGTDVTVEGTDVFGFSSTGETRSKFFSSQRFIDDQVHCLSGDDLKACVVVPGVAYETSSGGPFFRDVNMNPAKEYSTLYWVMFSAHVQTEPLRPGLKGPYAIVFSAVNDPKPDPELDLSFVGKFGLNGYVPVEERGYVSGVASGVEKGFQIVLHWFNADAQYWTYAAADGKYTSPAIKPGNYTVVLYQNELKVATSNIVIKAGETATQDLASTWLKPANTIFQIGEWDSQPFGFLNADKFLRAHPSDPRMSNWGPHTYNTSTSKPSEFPMALFRDLNSNVTIHFTVPASQAGPNANATLRIGTTLAFQGGRPGVSLNDVPLEVKPGPVKIDSRGVTRGAYRGYGEIYTWTIPDLLPGPNKFVITVTSGSAGGGAFRSPNYIFDALHLHSPYKPGALITPFGRCGGRGWSGVERCAAGYECLVANEWYSQCLPIA